MAHGHFQGHQFSTDIPRLLKLPHFWKVAVTTAIWHRRVVKILRCEVLSSLNYVDFGLSSGLWSRVWRISAVWPAGGKPTPVSSPFSSRH
jgi:hypothetical protein